MEEEKIYEYIIENINKLLVSSIDYYKGKDNEDVSGYINKLQLIYDYISDLSDETNIKIEVDKVLDNVKEVKELTEEYTDQLNVINDELVSENGNKNPSEEFDDIAIEEEEMHLYQNTVQEANDTLESEDIPESEISEINEIASIEHQEPVVVEEEESTKSDDGFNIKFDFESIISSNNQPKEEEQPKVEEDDEEEPDEIEESDEAEESDETDDSSDNVLLIDKNNDSVNFFDIFKKKK